MLERDPAGLVVTVPALRWGAEAFRYERGWKRLRELLGGPGDVGGVGDALGVGDVRGTGGMSERRGGL